MGEIKEFNRVDLEPMFKRIRAALNDRRIFDRISEDFTQAFTSFGLRSSQALEMVRDILGRLAESRNIDASERSIHIALRLNAIYNPELRRTAAIGDVACHLLRCQNKKMVDQLRPRLTKFRDGDPEKDPWLDMYQSISGAPDFVQWLSATDGCFDCPDGKYIGGIVGAILHYGTGNDRVLAELTRVIRPGGRLILIETMPLADTPLEREATFMNDYLRNRLFCDPGISMLNMKGTAESWAARFTRQDWKQEEFRDLGIGASLIRNRHVLYVFRKQKR